MSALDKQLSDNELNRFLRQALLEREDDALLTQLTDMEAAFVFAGAPMAIPGIAQEQLLIKKLGSKFAVKPWMKWMWPGAGTAGVAGIAIIVSTMMNPSTPPKQTVNEAVITPTEQAADEPKAEESNAVIIVNDDTLEALPQVPSVPQLPLLPSLSNSPLRALLPLHMIAPLAPGAPDLPKHPNAYLCRVTEGESSRSSIDTSFTGVKRLIVDGLCSDVMVKAGDQQAVSVKGHVNVETKGVVKGDKLNYVIRHKKEGDVLRVWVENSVRNVNMTVIGKIEIEALLDFIVPAGIDVELSNSSGDIVIEGMSGKVCKAAAVYGDIKSHGVATNVEFSTQSGDITLVNLKGNAKLESTYGDQQLQSVTGNVTCENASGDVTMNDVKGNIVISSTYGDVSLRNCSGKTAKLNLASGKIELTDTDFPSCNVSSTYGDIQGMNVNGNLHLETSSGDIRMEGITGNISCNSAYGDHSYNHIKGDIDVNSASGNMNLVNIAGNAKVNSTYGNLQLEDFKGDLEATVISGNIKGIRVELLSKLDITSTSGDIKMNLMNSLDDLSFDLTCDSGTIKVEKDGQKLTGKDNQLSVKKGSILVKANSSSGNQSFF